MECMIRLFHKLFHQFQNNGENLCLELPLILFVELYKMHILQINFFPMMYPIIISPIISPNVRKIISNLEYIKNKLQNLFQLKLMRIKNNVEVRLLLF